MILPKITYMILARINCDPIRVIGDRLCSTMTRSASLVSKMQLKTTNSNFEAPARLGSFAMVSDEAMDGLDILIRNNPTAARLLTILARHLPSGTHGTVVVSRNTLAELLDMSVPSVQRAIKVLKDGNWVKTTKISGAFAFAINSRAVWRGNREGIQHAVFHATIIASSSEQSAEDMRDSERDPRHVPIVQGNEQVIVTEPLAAPPAQLRLAEMDAGIPSAPAHTDAATGEITDLPGYEAEKTRRLRNI